jgi:hypothetical protein
MFYIKLRERQENTTRKTLNIFLCFFFFFFRRPFFFFLDEEKRVWEKEKRVFFSGFFWPAMLGLGEEKSFWEKESWPAMLIFFGRKAGFRPAVLAGCMLSSAGGGWVCWRWFVCVLIFDLLF